MDGEERYDKKKVMRKTTIAGVLMAVYLLCIFVFFDFLSTCTGSMVNGILFGIVILTFYFAAKEAKEKTVRYCFYVWALFMILILIWIIRLECILLK